MTAPIGEPAVERSLVLADEATVAKLVAAADAAGWTVGYTNHCGHNEFEQILWIDAGSGTRIRYVEHHTTGTRFLSVYGDDPTGVDTAIGVVTAAAATVGIDTILDELLSDDTTDPVALVRGFRRLAVAHYITRVHAHPAGDLDPRYSEAVRRHVAHPHRQVRLTVMMVADELSTLWPQLTAPIVARKDVETDHADLVDAFVAVAGSHG